MFFNDLIFIFILIVYSYTQNRILLYVFSKNRLNFLLDNNFIKPQAFHERPTYSLGGVAVFFPIFFTCLYLYYFKEKIHFEFISFCTLFFVLGFLDDLKIDIRPKFRLIMMVFLLIFLVIENQLYIEKTGFDFLNNLLQIDIFSLLFICLCFLFIINGSNLIDGFNGLLGIHSFIIFIILLLINLTSGEKDLSFILFCMSAVILVFIKFNFPKAQMFLGDGGAYLIGSFISVSVISTSILNPEISPFFFCIILFYLFFEVFFSFSRKIFIAKKNPLFPDNQHLHMRVYKFLLKKNYTKIRANYTTSIYINLIYLLLIIPGIVFLENFIFCKYYFIFLLFVYIYFYKKLNNIKI